LIAERIAGLADGARHVRDAVVHHVFHHERRRGMGRGPTRGHAAPLVDRHVDDHGPRLHQGQILAVDEVRRPGTRDEHAADHEVGTADLVADRVPVGEQAVDVRRRYVVEVAEPFEVRVEEADVGTEAGRHLGRVGADGARPEDRDVRGGHPGNAAEEDAPAHLRLLQVLGPFLDAHPARHLAHRHEQWKPAAFVPQRLVGDGRRARCQEAFGQAAVGGEVKIGEHRLAAPDEGQLGRLRLLDLDDEIGPAKNLGRRLHDRGSAAGVEVVGEAGAGPRGPLHEHGVPRADEFLRPDGQE